MSPPPIPSKPDLIIAAWPHLPLHLRLRIAARVYLHLHPIKPLPKPVRLATIHTLLTFIILAFLPVHPLSIPTALGLASCLTLYIRK